MLATSFKPMLGIFEDCEQDDGFADFNFPGKYSLRHLE